MQLGRWIYPLFCSVKYWILVNDTAIGFFQNLLGKSFIGVLLMFSPLSIAVNDTFLFRDLK